MMFVAHLLAGSIAAAGPGARQPEPELAPLRADVAPTKFRLRTGRFFVGGQWRATLTGPNAPCWWNTGCGVSPVLGFDLESGSRAARLLTGVYTAPMPWVTGGSDGEQAEFLMLEVGALFGGPNVRAGFSARFGLMTFAAGTLLLRATPFVGPRGGRHGFELRVGSSYAADLSVGLNYAWHPPRLERTRARRRRRAR